MKLGAIADDYSGATDLCSSWRREGLRSGMLTDLASNAFDHSDFDAVAVALKTRTVPAGDAVKESLAALDWLRSGGFDRYYFKYCSTFDSTPSGNIGPVLDALCDSLETPFTIVCPAHPEQGRSVYQGHLFVGSTLLSDSSMADHPLTPMRDSSLVRLLRQQTRRGVGLVPYRALEAGPEAISRELRALVADGCRYAVTDAIAESHLIDMVTACSDIDLLSGAAGIGWAMAHALGRKQVPPLAANFGGARVALAGSTSVTTLNQVEAVRGLAKCIELNPLQLRDQEAAAKGLADQVLREIGHGPVVVYSGTPPDRLKAIQQELGRAEAGALLERTFGQIAGLLVDQGVDQLVVAGGETSAAVVRSLGLGFLETEGDIEPGVPWMRSRGQNALRVALKSGNFGSRDFLKKALGI